MTKKVQEDIYYQAMLARDHRFDGKFFVGVKTTGIYCRPICPAKPKRSNVEFFISRLEAERKGYRPCMRCYPESAPDSQVLIGKSEIVNRVIALMRTGDISEKSLGISSRHLRRIFVEEIGKTPKQILNEERINLARKLIVETNLSLTNIAFASGFSSIRRFNDAFKLRFKKAPSELRKNKILSNQGPIVIGLSYRPPFDYEGLINSYKNHQMGNLEWFEDQKMFRVVHYYNKVGTVGISNDAKNAKIILEIDFPDVSAIHSIILKVKSLFDLNSDPLLITNCFEEDSLLKALLNRFPGVRLPSGWDNFEIAVATILGQLVSTDMARKLVHDLIENLGESSGFIREEKMIRFFPTPEVIWKSDLKFLKTTEKRKETLKEFSRMVFHKELSLESAQDSKEFVTKLMSIKGIGPWSANYMALKVIKDTDAFPASDLILARALEIHSKESIEKMSPWRGYVASLFWRAYTENLSKKKGKKK